MNCDQCNKTFKRAQDLKTHNTKFHKEEVIVEQPILEVTQEIAGISVFEQIPQETFESEYESSCELIDEIDVEFIETESICQDSCSTTKHCETCTCGVEQIEVSQVSAIRKSMGSSIYSVQHYLSGEDPLDIELCGNRILETAQNGLKVIKDVEFKCYDSPIITDRVVKQQFNYTMKRLPDMPKFEQHTYMNFKNKLTNYEACMKYSIENDIQFNADTFNPTMIAYDIESFHPTDKNLIPTHLNGGVMSMICASFSKVEQIDNFNVYVLNQYSYNRLEIEESIIERRTLAKCPEPTQFKLNIVECENQTVMACTFLDDVKACGQALMYGFNSSCTIKEDQRNDYGKLVKREQIGYDLPFIIHCSGRYTQEQIEHGCKLFGKTGRQIKAISWLPNVYILDCSIVFQNARFFALKLSELPNRKLNAFLDCAQIPTKLDDMSIQQRMDQMRIRGSDMSSTISYCIWDSYALTLVLDKIQYLASVKANVQIFNIPLSWALHKNASAWITMYMLRKFYNAGFSFSYAKFQMGSKKTFLGATTEQCPDELQQQVLERILLGDFESLYPNCIIACNLGIDSILECKTGDCYTINLNFVDSFLMKAINEKVAKQQPLTKSEIKLQSINATENLVYFSKTPSVYSTTIYNVLQERLSVKKEMDKEGLSDLQLGQMEARQNALKIIVNTIYGLSGCQTFQLYDERIAAACTSIARNLTEIARIEIENDQLGQCVFRDTDSAGILNVPADVDTIKAQFTQLNENINSTFQDRFNNTHLIKFVPEIDNYQTKTYYPKAKKAYARLELNLKKMHTELHLKIKGVSWSLMSEYGKYYFQNVTRHILDNLTSSEDIQTYVNQQIQLVRTDILTLIETKNYSELTRKYYKQIKNSAHNQTAKYLRQKLNCQENEIRMLPIVKASKLKSECVIPTRMMCDQVEIDVNTLIDWFISPMKKFFGKQEYEQSEYNEFESLIEVRIADQNGYKSKTKKYSYDDILERLDNYKISYNEVIQSTNKLFFDIDDSINETNFYKCLELIESLICKFNMTQISISMAYTKSTSKTKPFSYHVVYQIQATVQMNLYIAKQVNQIMGFEILDIALYSVGKSLRLPLSPKYCEKTQKLVQVYHVMVQGSLEDMLVTGLDNCPNKLSTAIGFTQKPHKQMGYENIQLTDQYTQAIKQYIPFEYEIKSKKENCITIDPIIKPYMCPVCKRQHENQNMKMYIRATGFTIDCWATQSRDKKHVINHRFENYNQLGDAEKRNLQLQKALDRNVNYTFSDIDQANVAFQHNQQVEYNLDAQTTFVRSQMMTGKTKQQVQLTESGNYKTILALSFRRTFARDNASKNQFVNYEDVQGSLNLYDYPKLILQVDSLTRLDTKIMPDLLIVDEIESIIEQLTAIHRDTTPYILYKFMELLKSQTTKILFLDAELEQSTVQMLTSIIGTNNYRVFINTYQPKTDYNITITDFVCSNTAQRASISDQVMQLVCKDKKKVVLSCTSSTLASGFKLALENSNENLKICYYDGIDSKKHNEQSMALIKHNDFKNVNESWKDIDVLIYTGTLTAGISFELEHFDCLIGIYAKKTASPLAFTQGLHRVRNLKEKQMYLYLENEYGSKPQTAWDITEMQSYIYGHTDLSEINQLSNWIQASKAQSVNQSLDIVIRNLKNMGYNLEVLKSTESASRQLKDAVKSIKDQEIDDIVSSQITLEDLVNIPRTIKSTRALMADVDPLLQAKYIKIKLFKSYFEEHSQENLDKLNQFDDGILSLLIANRPEIVESNTLKNIVKKCLNVRPQLRDLTNEQIDTVFTAMRLESNSNLTAQLSDTVAKQSISKLSNEFYLVKQALNAYNQLKVDSSAESITKLIKNLQSDALLGKLGVSLKCNGDHHKLNKLLTYIDVEMKVAESNRVRIDKKQVTINSYKFVYTDAQSVLDNIEETIRKRKEAELKRKRAAK